MVQYVACFWQSLPTTCYNPLFLNKFSYVNKSIIKADTTFLQALPSTPLVTLLQRVPFTQMQLVTVVEGRGVVHTQKVTGVAVRPQGT